MAVVGEEMGPSLEKLRGAPRELLSRPTKKHMRRLEDYRHLFPVVDPTTGALPTVKRDDCTRPGCSICNITTCKACKLSHFFQNAKAVRALEIVAKGRKKRGGAWPETCAWLDPKPGPNWEARWRRQANYVLKDRSNVNKWLKQGGWENTTSERYSSEIDMRAEHCESNVLDENGDEKLPGERPVSFIPSFKEMTPSPPGSPYGSPPGSPSVSSSGSPYRSLSDWGKDMTPSSASSVRNSTYTWESKILDEYALDPKRWCFDENATKEEVLTNLKTMGEEEDDSDDDSKDHMQRGEIKPNDRAVSYANVIGDLTPTQSTFVLPQAPKLEFPDRPERAEEAEGEEEYDWDEDDDDWDEDDDEEETLLVGRKADEWAGSYTNLIGNMPPTQSNLALPQFDDRRSYTDTTPLVGRRQPGPHC